MEEDEREVSPGPAGGHGGVDTDEVGATRGDPRRCSTSTRELVGAAVHAAGADRVVAAGGVGLVRRVQARNGCCEMSPLTPSHRERRAAGGERNDETRGGAAGQGALFRDTGATPTGWVAG